MIVAYCDGKAQDDPGAGFAVIEEAAAVIEQRCFYPVTIPQVLAGVLAAVRAGEGGAAEDGDLASLSAEEAWSEFKRHLSEHAARPGQRLDAGDLIESGLSAYCEKIDPWSRYYSVADTARIDQFRDGAGSGIGVNLREAAGIVYLYPMPESPAALAGVKPGDTLISVDGRAVEGRPLQLVASWIKGTAGTQTTLRVARQAGRSQLIPVLRESVPMPAVLVESDITGVTLRIRNFEKNLPKEIREAIEGQPRARSVTLDLRGCHGGWMNAAVEVARLFVPKGKRLLTLAERGAEPQVYEADAEEPPLRPLSISLLQDGGTGSAAEILIAALVENLPRQAASSGERSHGKGVVQEVIRLKSGGELHLTTGILFGPSGKSWNSLGLMPSTGNQGSIFPEGAVEIGAPAGRPQPKIRLVD